MIDWDALGQNLKKQHLFSQIRLVKYMHNWLHVGRHKNLMNATDLGFCPVYLKEKETWQHLLCCTHNDSLAIRTLAVTQFKSSLFKCKTALIICSTLIYKLLQWLGLATAPPPVIPSDQLGTIFHTAIEEQAEIG
eukprot:2542311-Ditylum_brightwellii.AAC.1